ncbi:5-oxoprolinase subunit C family protein [Reichenbachiella versicolor]|uniref:5-oxoprolinase subunit C family protein n=1 Tax=Reichenbachiella versicolor TaxID=1821036 RepID=UPI000D6E4AA4|nr:biotin-dependent carboxyltransferase family protein [Reichenbachiella versicolor]
MSRLFVESTGVYCSIQDFGRFGYKKLGVPESGVMDRVHAGIANLILRNNFYDPLIELAFGGLKIRSQGKTLISVTGPIDFVWVNGKKVSSFTVIHLEDNDTLSIPYFSVGVYTYLAVIGGIHTEEVLGSCSQTKHITKKERVFKGDVFEVKESDRIINLGAKVKKNQNYFSEGFIEVYKGPDYQEGLIDISNYFKISNKSNRQAYLLHSNSGNIDFKEILTSSVMPGTVQLTKSGQLNVLMRDSQTTGGYPRVFQLTEESIGRLAQRRPGGKVKFRVLD